MQQAPATLADPWRTLDIAITRDRADSKDFTVQGEVIQVSHRIDIDENGGTREAKAHGGDKALSPCQYAGLGSMLLQVREVLRLLSGIGSTRKLRESRRSPDSARRDVTFRAASQGALIERDNSTTGARGWGKVH